MLKFFFPGQGREYYPHLSWFLRNKPFIQQQQQPPLPDKVARVHEYEPPHFGPGARPTRARRNQQETVSLVPEKYPVAKRVVMMALLNRLTAIGFREAERSHIEYLDGSRNYLSLDQQVVTIRVRGIKKPDGSWSNYLGIYIDGVSWVTSLLNSFEPVDFMGHEFQMRENVYKGQVRRPLLLEDGVIQWANGRPAGSIERYVYRIGNPFHLPVKAGGVIDRLKWVGEDNTVKLVYWDCGKFVTQRLLCPPSERLVWSETQARYRDYSWQEYEWSPGDVFLNAEVDQDSPPDKALRRTARLTDSERILFELDDIQAKKNDGVITERYDNVSVRSSDLYVTETDKLLNDQRDADVAWLYQSLAHHGRWPRFVTKSGIKVYPHNPEVLKWAEGFVDDLNLVADGSDEIKQYYLNQLRETWKLPKGKQLDAKRAIVAEVERLAEGLDEKLPEAPEVQWALDDGFMSLEPVDDYTPCLDDVVSSIRDRAMDSALSNREEVLSQIASHQSYLDTLQIRDVILEAQAQLAGLRDKLTRMDEKLSALNELHDVVGNLTKFYQAPEAPEAEGYKDSEYEDDGFDVIDEETGITHYSSEPCLDGIHAAAFYGYRPILSNQVPDWPVSARAVIDKAYPESIQQQQLGH